MNATLAAPRVSPTGPSITGSPSARTSVAPPGTARTIRPLLLVTGGVPGGGGGPAGWVKPAGGVPDSAMYSAPSGPQVKPRGFARPLTTTWTFGGGGGGAGWANDVGAI